jgi:Dyp-type peroxidase family
MREQVIDFQDVQGLVRGYGKSLGHGVFLILSIRNAGEFRKFLKALKPPTTMEEWPGGPPDTATNIAFSYLGLEALGLPADLLATFPEEFKQGMSRRPDVNGDLGSNAPAAWEHCWTSGFAHAWIGVYARDDAALVQRHQQILGLGRGTAFDVIYTQPVQVLQRNEILIEHFGFVDGVSEPAIEGVARPEHYAGSKLDQQEREPLHWQPIAPGEFLLGHYKDEADERPVALGSLELATNGTFMVYRKLEQDVHGFWEDLNHRASALNVTALEIAEQMVGRRRDGTPLVTTNSRDRNDFYYRGDPQGQQCPLGAHVRRANPRDQFGFGTVLVDRRRILRRGMPYGSYASGSEAAHDERGLIFIALNASIARQFEFVQRRWINDGSVFGAGNDRDPIAGTQPGGRFAFNAENGNSKERRVTVCSDLKSFVTMRGGEYFFLPGLGGVRYLAEGIYHI